MTSAEPPCFVAGEGGGTRFTLWLVPCTGGDPVARHVAGPANLTTLGVDRFVDRFEDSLSTLLAGSGRGRADVTGITLALAGLESPAAAAPLRAALAACGPGASALPAPTIALGSDAGVTLLGATAGGPGALLLAGTGSIALVRDAEGIETRCGGWGSAVGDDGSGHDLGRRVLRRLVLHLDGRSPEDLLMRLFEAHRVRGEDPATKARDWIRKWSPAADRVAALAPVLVEAAGAGDAASGRDLDDAARSLVALAMDAIRRAGLAPTAPLFLHGGLLHEVPAYRERVLAGLRGAEPDRPVSLTPAGGLLAGLRLQLEHAELCRPA